MIGNEPCCADMVKDINNITMLVYIDFMGLLPVFQIITLDVHPWHQPVNKTGILSTV